MKQYRLQVEVKAISLNHFKSDSKKCFLCLSPHCYGEEDNKKQKFRAVAKSKPLLHLILKHCAIVARVIQN